MKQNKKQNWSLIKNISIYGGIFLIIVLASVIFLVAYTNSTSYFCSKNPK